MISRKDLADIRRYQNLLVKRCLQDDYLPPGEEHAFRSLARKMNAMFEPFDGERIAELWRAIQDGRSTKRLSVRPLERTVLRVRLPQPRYSRSPAP